MVTDGATIHGEKKNIHGKPFVVMLYKPSICLREKNVDVSSLFGV